MSNASVHVSEIEMNKLIKIEVKWLTICPYFSSLNPIEKIRAIKSKCMMKLYNNNVKMNSSAIIKKSR